jgi:acetyltransferase
VADACALDVHVKVTREIKEFPATAPGQFFGHMAIPPYPKHLAKEVKLPSGGDITVRPIRPEDAEIERDFVNNLSKEAKYFRFMQALQKISPEMLVRYTQIDYDREMAFLASVPEDGFEREIGIARYVINPDGKSCEFAIVVGDEWQGRGVGSILMDTLMEEARTKEIKRMEGQVLVGNHNMLAMMNKLGFKVEASEESLDIKEVSLDL